MALPTLSAADLGGDAAISLAEFIVTPAFARRCRRLAAMLVEDAGKPIGLMLPGLRLIAGGPLTHERLPTRIALRLDKFGWQTWSDVARCTPADVLGMRAVGRDTTVELLALAVGRSLGALAAGGSTAVAPDWTELPSTGFHTPGRPDLPAEVPAALPAGLSAEVSAEMSAALGVLARYSALEDDPEPSLGRLLADPAPADLPPDVAAAARLLRDGPIAAAPPPDDRVERLLDPLDAEASDLVRSRRPLVGRDSLQVIADRRCLSKERVRQLEEKARAALEALVGTDAHAEVRWDLHRINLGLGTGLHVGDGDPLAVARSALPPRAGRWADDALEVLLWLAGPYRLMADGWLRRGDLPDADAAAAAVSPEGRVDLPSARSLLARRGLVPAAAEAWLRQRLPTKTVRGAALLWTGPVADRLARVLAVLDAPADVEQLLAEAGEELSTRSVRVRLMSDGRFVRTDRNRFGLQSWGMDEYGGLAAAIADELEHRPGGSGEAADVVEVVARRFNARPQSVAYFLKAPMFALEGGRVRLRGEDERGPDVEGVEGIEAVGGLARLGPDAVAWEAVVDRDHLRGSGRPIAPEVAAWAGVEPGGTGVHFAGAAGGVRIFWSRANPQPNVGSVRVELERLGASEGDRIRIRLDRAGRRIDLSLIDADGAPLTARSSPATPTPTARSSPA